MHLSDFMPITSSAAYTRATCNIKIDPNDKASFGIFETPLIQFAQSKSLFSQDSCNQHVHSSVCFIRLYSARVSYKVGTGKWKLIFLLPMSDDFLFSAMHFLISFISLTPTTSAVLSVVKEMSIQLHRQCLNLRTSALRHQHPVSAHVFLVLSHIYTSSIYLLSLEFSLFFFSSMFILNYVHSQ